MYIEYSIISVKEYSFRLLYHSKWVFFYLVIIACSELYFIYQSFSVHIKINVIFTFLSNVDCYDCHFFVQNEVKINK